MYRKLPNLLTVARLALAPFIVWLIVRHSYGEALALVVLAGITDALDGFAARRFGAVTRSGAYLDPIADKALLCCLYIAFGFSGAVPWWLVAVVFGRDLFILGQVAAAMILTTIRDFHPSIWGKLSTVVQVGAALILLIDNGNLLPRWFVFGAVTAAAFWSALHYAVRSIRELREFRQAERSKGVG